MDEQVRPRLGRQDRDFGLLWTAVFAALGAWFWRRGWPWAPAWAAPSVLALAVALIRPQWLASSRAAWMRMAGALARVNTVIILGVLYFLVLTPIALVVRWLGEDPLELKAQGSLWRARRLDRSRERYERQY